jgi:hypothetical protein
MKLTRIVCLLVLSALPLFANGGSVYSRYGIGDLRSTFSARRMGMGGLGIAMSDQQYISDINPASWNSLRLTRLEMAFLYNGDKLESKDYSVYHTSTVFNGLMLGFPIERDLGISLVMGIVPYTNVEYDVKEEIVDTIQTETHKHEYKGNGGINKFVIGASYRLPFGLSLGLSYDYYIGRIENTSVIIFSDSSTFVNAAFNRQMTYNGMGFTAGLISNDLAPYIGLSSIKNLRVGLTYSSAVSINTDSLMNMVTTVGTVTASTKSFQTELPYKLGVGISFNWTNDFLLNLDYLYQPFSKLTENGRTNQYMKDYAKYSFGLEYHNAEIRSGSFWDYIAVRGGISYEESQLTVKGTDFTQLSFYAGLLFPISFDNTLDVAFQYGTRGTTDNNLIKENFFKINFSLSLGDIWFTRVER